MALRIYTKTGDNGDTGLYGGARVPKDDLLVEAYGTVDELNCLLGAALAQGLCRRTTGIATELQSMLFVVGGDLASPLESETRSAKSIRRIGNEDVTHIELKIDELEERLDPLTTFILPGGSSSAATLHLARAVCRRAERLVVRASRERNLNRTVLVYLNRVSDLLFVMARYANKKDGVSDVPWSP